MANDPLSPVLRGEVLAVRADTWNAVLDATRQVLRPDRGDRPAAPRTRPGVIVARGLNATGTDLREGRPAALTGIGGYDLSDDYAAAHWQREPLLTLGVPASTSDRIAVTLEAIPDGAVGAVAIAGVVECAVNLGTAATARFARPTVGSIASLTGGTRGPIEVLAVAGGTGSTRRAVVLLGGCCDTGKRPLGPPCLVPDANGHAVGIAQRVERGDGTVECVTSGFCEGEGCGSGSVPPPPGPPPPPLPPLPPPPPPYLPPSPPPATYDVYVSVGECPGLTPTQSPYTVSVAGATNSPQAIAAGAGGWFVGVPWGTDTAAVVTATGPVTWVGVSVGCGGSPGAGSGTSAPVGGTFCGSVSVAFAVGGCPPDVPSGNILDYTAKPAIA